MATAVSVVCFFVFKRGPEEGLDALLLFCSALAWLACLVLSCPALPCLALLVFCSSFGRRDMPLSTGTYSLPQSLLLSSAAHSFAMHRAWYVRSPDNTWHIYLLSYLMVRNLFVFPFLARVFFFFFSSRLFFFCPSAPCSILCLYSYQVNILV